MKQCLTCHTQNPDSNNFCQQCGSALSQNTAQLSNSKKNKLARFMSVFAPMFLGCGLGGLIGVVKCFIELSNYQGAGSGWFLLMGSAIYLIEGGFIGLVVGAVIGIVIRISLRHKI